MTKCIYCGSEEFKKVKKVNQNLQYKCSGCGALYLSLKDVRKEIQNQIEWGVFEFDGKSYC